MTRIAVVSPTPTWPLNFGNRKRIYGVCRGLKERGVEVHLILYALEEDWRGNLPSEALKRTSWNPERDASQLKSAPDRLEPGGAESSV